MKDPKHPADTETLETTTDELARGTVFAGRYEIIEELGGGGMGKVYRVDDRKLKQEIAVKLIKPEIAKDKETVERFRNELKSARMIAHKNVCRMFDMGESKETHFITMEYVRGEDLKSMIRMSGQLGTGTAISIARQICEGLSEAHRHGVVHRDLKSSNIMIDKAGTARIMDFGIARSLKGKGITGAGVIIGTPEYMSPEQVEGKEADQRSDIYSLGIILYEMLTGRVPFEGDTPFTVGVKQKSEPPPDPASLNPGIPDALGALILKCLEKDKGRRYQSADEIKAELERVKEGLPATATTLSAKKAPTSKEITVTVSLKKWVVPVVAAAVLIAAGIGIRQLVLSKSGGPPIAGKPTIAVLPFEDRNPQEGSADLCRETMIGIYDKLTRLGKFDVKSRFLVKEYENSDKGPLAIGRELGVSYVLVGSMYIGGGKFSANVELLNAGDGSRVWNRTIPGKFGDILSVQGEVAEEIVARLNMELSPEEKDVLQQRPTESSEAFRKYAIGRGFYAKRTPKDVRMAVEYFEQAIGLDPDYALAYSGLADAYSSLDDARARDAASRALALDDKLAEAHTSLANIKLGFDWDWEGAELGFKRALALDPNYAIARHWHGRLLTMLGRYDEAIAEMERARELDPTDVTINRNLGLTYLYAGQVDRAVGQLLETLKMDPDFPLTKQSLTLAYIRKSMLREILELYDHDDTSQMVQLAHVLELARQDREKAVEVFEEYRGDLVGFNIAVAYALLGEREKVFSNLERAYEDHDWNMEFLKVFPIFEEYHSDPRFQALLKKMQLD